MNLDTELCPACLEELPGDYPFDHVAIDRALAKDRSLLRGMAVAERAETIRIGLSRGSTVSQLAKHFRWGYVEIAQLAGDHADPVADDDIESEVRRGWEQGLSDGAIALRTGRYVGTISKIRVRIGLPALFGPGGRPVRTAVAA